MSKDFRLRIAHLSDLHFSKPSYNPLQLFSKRWIGNINFIFSRKKVFNTERLHALVPLFKNLGLDHVIISGDLSTTSLDKEFKEAAAFVEQIKAQKIDVFTIPGNHDQYTKSAYKKQLFYEFFDGVFTLENQPVYNYNLRKHQVAAKFLRDKWWLVALDTAVATSLVSSRGYFSEELEENLKEVLKLIPKDDHIILTNHFPFFNHESIRKTLVRSHALKNMIRQHPNIKFYLHGHTHHHCIADLRANGLPLVLDSGSASHMEAGSWNLIDITAKGCEISVYHFDEKNTGTWKQRDQVKYTWQID